MTRDQAADAAYTEREAERLRLRFAIARAKHRERALQRRLEHLRAGTADFHMTNVQSINELAAQLVAQRELRRL